MLCKRKKYIKPVDITEPVDLTDRLRCEVYVPTEAEVPSAAHVCLQYMICMPNSTLDLQEITPNKYIASGLLTYIYVLANSHKHPMYYQQGVKLDTFQGRMMLPNGSCAYLVDIADKN